MCRDLKFENVVLVSEDFPAPVKVVDFGAVVQPSAPSAEARAIYIDKPNIGTPGYFAPESVADLSWRALIPSEQAKQYSAASDVWQLGVLLYGYDTRGSVMTLLSFIGTIIYIEL